MKQYKAIYCRVSSRKVKGQTRQTMASKSKPSPSISKPIGSLASAGIRVMLHRSHLGDCAKE